MFENDDKEIASEEVLMDNDLMDEVAKQFKSDGYESDST